MEDIIDEYNLYISDLENGKYKFWLKQYPDNRIEIFQDLIDHNMDNLIDLVGFEDLLNIKGNFRNDTNMPVYPLEAVAEFRKINNFKTLLYWGADSANGNVLMALLTGHSAGYCTNEERNIIDVENGIIQLQLYQHKQTGLMFPEEWNKEFECYSTSEIIMNYINKPYYKLE